MSGTTRLVLTGASIATVDPSGTEYDEGHVVVEDGRIVAVGPGEARVDPSARTVDARGCLVTPGLVNTHHHLYQWLTRGLAQESPLFDWLTELYPAWTALDEDNTLAAATAGLAQLALSGCTTAADHHYVFPREGGDVAGAVVSAAESVGTRLHLVRGSMDRGTAHGGASRPNPSSRTPTRRWRAPRRRSIGSTTPHRVPRCVWPSGRVHRSRCPTG